MTRSPTNIHLSVPSFIWTKNEPGRIPEYNVRRHGPRFRRTTSSAFFGSPTLGSGHRGGGPATLSWPVHDTARPRAAITLERHETLASCGGATVAAPPRT